MELIDDDGNFYVYTDVGHKRDGVWTTTGESWQKGVCIMQFNRSCPAGKTEARQVAKRIEGKRKKQTESQNVGAKKKKRKPEKTKANGRS